MDIETMLREMLTNQVPNQDLEYKLNLNGSRITVIRTWNQWERSWKPHYKIINEATGMTVAYSDFKWFLLGLCEYIRVQQEVFISERIAVIFSYPSGFKACSLKDAETFIFLRKKATGDIYWSDEEKDYCLGLYNGNGTACWRWRSERGDILAPYLAESGATAIQIVYSTRKYINKRYFND